MLTGFEQMWVYFEWILSKKKKFTTRPLQQPLRCVYER